MYDCLSAPSRIAISSLPLRTMPRTVTSASANDCRPVRHARPPAAPGRAALARSGSTNGSRRPPSVVARRTAAARPRGCRPESARHRAGAQPRSTQASGRSVAHVFTAAGLHCGRPSLTRTAATSFWNTNVVATHDTVTVPRPFGFALVLIVEVRHRNQPRHRREPVEEAAEVVKAAFEAELNRPLRVLRLGHDRLRLEAGDVERRFARQLVQAAQHVLRILLFRDDGRGLARATLQRLHFPLERRQLVGNRLHADDFAFELGQVRARVSSRRDCRADRAPARRRPAPRAHSSPKTIICARGDSSWKLLAMTRLPAFRRGVVVGAAGAARRRRHRLGRLCLQRRTRITLGVFHRLRSAW